ncbi:MAG: FecR domain-containing protein [Puia sp.]
MMRHQNDYAGFAEGQFAADEYFQQWVLEANSLNRQFWESYLLLHPVQKENIQKARLLVKELASGNYRVSPLSPEEKAVIKENIYQTLNMPSSAGPVSLFSGWKKNWREWAAVAALAVIGLPAYFLIRSDIKSAGEEKNNKNLLTVKTGAGEIKRIVLEDSSVVILNANSSLQCANHFQTGTSREVFLQGNAFFSVEKDRGHSPFVVHAGSLVITVLGTELNVNARSAETEVELTRGKVKVEQVSDKSTTIYLQPGEKIKLDASRKTLIRSKMSPDLYSAWTQGEWNFHQTSLQDITGLLKEYYGVETVFINERTRHLRINAVMAVSSLYKLVPVIEQTLQIKIEILNNRLIVQ